MFNPLGKPSLILLIFKGLVLKDLHETKIKKVQQKYINQGIKSLCDRKDLINRPADKGGGIVLLNREVEQPLSG